MKPPTSAKADDPLEAEAWINAIEAKFSAAAMLRGKQGQLRGSAAAKGSLNVVG
jgi:hypothetical protein